MARTIRDAAIGSRESRLKLRPGSRHWKAVHQGLAVCYRRGKQGSGTWSVRVLLSNGSYALRVLGSADDYAPSNGADVLTFAQAQKQARELAALAKRDEGIITRPLTVSEAADRYLEWFSAHRRSVRETRHTVEAHIRPHLG